MGVLCAISPASRHIVGGPVESFLGFGFFLSVIDRAASFFALVTQLPECGAVVAFRRLFADFGDASAIEVERRHFQSDPLAVGKIRVVCGEFFGEMPESHLAIGQGDFEKAGFEGLLDGSDDDYGRFVHEPELARRIGAGKCRWRKAST